MDGYTMPLLQRLDLVSYIDGVADGYSVVHGEPAPDVFIFAASLVNTPTPDCLGIEDATDGAEAIKAAGMTALGIGPRAFKKQEQKQEKGGYVRRERYEGEMTCVVTLPGAIDESKVKATYEQGVLSVRIPKSEGAQPRQIPVKVKEMSGTR